MRVHLDVCAVRFSAINLDNRVMRKMKAYLLILMFSLPLFAQANQEERQFTDIHGNAMAMSDMLGKWVVVNYWASWCPPCLEELPELEHFHHTHKDDLAVVLGINTEEGMSHSSLADFAEDFMLSFPIIPLQQELPHFGAVPGLPTTFLINPEGEVVARQVGKVTAEMIENFIARER